MFTPSASIEGIERDAVADVESDIHVGIFGSHIPRYRSEQVHVFDAAPFQRPFQL